MTETLDNPAVNDQSARITRVYSLPASPGCCAICGKEKHEKGFAATDNFDFEFYGTVYFCADCVGDYARVFGYISPENLRDVMTKLTSQEEELALLRRSVVNLETLVDAYANVRGDLSVGDDSDAGPVSAPEDAIEPNVATEGPVLSLVTESSGSGEAEQPEVNEPVAEQGRNDLRSLTSTDLSEFGLDL